MELERKIIQKRCLECPLDGVCWCKLTCPQQQHSGDDQQLSSLQLWSHTQTLHRWLI